MRPNALDFTDKRYHRGIVDEIERARNRTKSKVQSKVEHAFHVIKRLFGFVMVRYRGLDNAHRLFVTCALANLFMARRQVFPTRRVVCPDLAFRPPARTKSAPTSLENQVKPPPGHSLWWRSS